jgi:hypothetical protein
MSHVVRSWAAAAVAVMALVSAPVAIMTIVSPAVSRADVCADAGGRHVDVGGCTDPGAAVYAAPPPADVPPPAADVPPPPADVPPPPADVPPPPAPPPGPDLDVCVVDELLAECAALDEEPFNSTP